MEIFYIQKKLLFNKLLLVKNKMYFYNCINTIKTIDKKPAKCMALFFKKLRPAKVMGKVKIYTIELWIYTS
jgi:hypothetical protein